MSEGTERRREEGSDGRPVPAARKRTAPYTQHKHVHCPGVVIPSSPGGGVASVFALDAHEGEAREDRPESYAWSPYRISLRYRAFGFDLNRAGPHSQTARVTQAGEWATGSVDQGRRGRTGRRGGGRELGPTELTTDDRPSEITASDELRQLAGSSEIGRERDREMLHRMIATAAASEQSEPKEEMLAVELTFADETVVAFPSFVPDEILTNVGTFDPASSPTVTGLN